MPAELPVNVQLESEKFPAALIAPPLTVALLLLKVLSITVMLLVFVEAPLLLVLMAAPLLEEVRLVNVQSETTMGTELALIAAPKGDVELKNVHR